MRKIISIILCITVIMSVSCTALASGNYTGASNWAIAELTYADEASLVPDMMKDGFFSFSNPITREDFCNAVVLFYNKIGGKHNVGTENPFSDVSTPQVIKAYNAGIIKGKSTTQFKPKDNLTRQEMCVMIVRALDSAGTTNYEAKTGFQKDYVDISYIASWAVPSVESMNAHKIINGTSEQYISPTDQLTGEQAIIMLYRAYVAFSKEEIAQDDSFTIEDGVLTKCIGIGDIVIPNTVTSIDPEVFYDFSGMTSITIPGTVKEVPYEAFRYCTDLKEVTLLEGVEKIGAWSFAECPNLQAVTLPSSLISIEEGAFNNCDKLDSIAFNEGLCSIGYTAFRGIKATEIILPSTLTTLGDEAFYLCANLHKVTFENAATTIEGDYTFAEGSPDLAIICEKGSAVERYAIEHDFTTEEK